VSQESLSTEPSATRTSGPTSLICPGCGSTVAAKDVDVMFVADVTSTPLQIGKCVLLGIVLGLVAGVILPRQALRGASAGALIVGAIAWVLARRYNRRMQREPVDLWPNSVSCPECGRVFGRYRDGGGPDVPVWP
jgi:prepilin signal peptidase PulO-like enzyme (type II secretory pathway)